MKNQSNQRNAPRAAKAEVVPSQTLVGSPEPGAPESHRCIRIKRLVPILGMSASTIYRKVKKGTFPPPIRIFPRISVWRWSTVQAWLQTQEGRK